MSDELARLHDRILGCRLCEHAGWINLAAPVVSGQATNRIMLIGQAPGITELQIRRPFAGRAGRELFRWLQSIGIPEKEFRDRVYMTAVTKCYPGRARSGSGDRRPSAQEMTMCKPFLEQQFALIQPDSVLLVGGMAIERFLPNRPLSQLIGQRFEICGVAFVPLPHPSGASRWLNELAHKQLLSSALDLVRSEWDRVVQESGPVSSAG